MIRRMSARSGGLLWALVVCPVIGWVVAVRVHGAVEGGLEVPGAVFFLAIVPAALAAAGNIVLERSRGAVVRAAMLAAGVCWGGFLLMIILFFLSFDPN
jgi:hypothetical protein